MPTSHHAAQGDPERCLDGVRRKAIVAADALMLTDAPLLFPPGQLALAALRSGVRSVRHSASLTSHRFLFQELLGALTGTYHRNSGRQ